jgi:hypothetical protein
MVEDHIDIPEVVLAISFLEVGIDVLEKFDPAFIVGKLGHVVLGVLQDQVYNAIDEDVLADAPRPFYIVEFSLRIVPDVGDVDLPGHRVPGQEFRHDLLWQNDQLLALKTFTFAQGPRSFQFRWVLCKIQKEENNPSFS